LKLQRWGAWKWPRTCYEPWCNTSDQEPGVGLMPYNMAIYCLSAKQGKAGYYCYYYCCCCCCCCCCLWSLLRRRPHDIFYIGERNNVNALKVSPYTLPLSSLSSSELGAFRRRKRASKWSLHGQGAQAWKRFSSCTIIIVYCSKILY